MHRIGSPASPTDSDGTPRPGRVRRHAWTAFGALFVVICVGLAAIGSAVVAKNDAAASARSARNAANQVAASLTLALQQKNDMISAAGVFLADNPSATNKQLGRWFAAIGGFTRYPEVIGLADVVLVTAAELPAYAASEEAHPTGLLGAGGKFVPIPPGKRPYYCFSKVEVQRTGTSLPAAEDYCATSTMVLSNYLTIEDSGVASYRPVNYGAERLLGIVTPLYRVFPIPSSVAARRLAFVGWLGTSSTPSTLLDLAIVGRPHTAVSFSYGSGAAQAAYHAGNAPVGATAISLKVDGGWTLEIYDVVASDGVFANGNSTELLWLF
ncbi:MAG TPA: hypothetical protein VIJ34_13440 [Acidimicrobiales bacterium]